MTNKLTELMVEAYNTRWSNYDKVICYEEMPPIRSLSPGSFLGTNSYTDRKSCVRYIRQSSIVDLGYGTDTYTSFVRDYVKSKFVRGRAWSKQLDAVRTNDVHPPLFCYPGNYPDSVYIDIKSAYYQICSIVGWDVHYWPHRFIRLGKSINDFPLKEHKAARASLVTQFWRSTIKMFDGEKITRKEQWGENTLLYRLVCDVLCGFALDLMKCIDVHYIHTDGAIVSEKDLDKCYLIAHHWGINICIKGRGTAQIKRIGAYKIGDKTTKPYDLIGKPGCWLNIPYVDTAWLRPKLASARRKRDRDETQQ